MRIFLRLLLVLLTAGAPMAFGNIPSASELAGEALNRRMKESPLGQESKTFSAWLMNEVEAYDLTKDSRKAFEGVAMDPAFLKLLEKRGIEVDEVDSKKMFALITEYLGSSTNVRPAAVAWLGLIFDFGAPWKKAHALYLKVAAERPDDFLPKAVTLARPVRTKEEAVQWLTLFKEAYASARRTKDRSACLVMLLPHAAYAANISDAAGHLQNVSDWLDDLEKNETAERLPSIHEIPFMRVWVTFFRKDFVAAAEQAKGTKVRAFEPLFLLMASKVEDAGKALDRLQPDGTLSEEEKQLLRSTKDILDGLKKVKDK